MAAGVLLEAVAVEVVAGAVSWGSLGSPLGSSWTLLCSLRLAEGIIWSSGGSSGALHGLFWVLWGYLRPLSILHGWGKEALLCSLKLS